MKDVYSYETFNKESSPDGFYNEGSTLKAIEFKNCVFENMSLNNITFHGCTFEKCSFINCKIFNNRFVNCNFYITKFTNTEFNEHARKPELTVTEFTKFINSKLFSVDFFDCRCYRVNFSDSTIQSINFKDCDLSYGTFKNNSFNLLKIRGSDLYSIEFLDNKIILTEIMNCNISETSRFEFDENNLSSRELSRVSQFLHQIYVLYSAQGYVAESIKYHLKTRYYERKQAKGFKKFFYIVYIIFLGMAND